MLAFVGAGGGGGIIHLEVNIATMEHFDTLNFDIYVESLYLSLIREKCLIARLGEDVF